MKKISMFVTAMLLSFSAQAGTIAANADTAARTIDTTACGLLTERVVINLSKDVVAGYECDETVNVIAFAACNPNGRKSGSDNYIFVGSSAGGQIGAAGTDGAASAPCAADAAEAAAQAAIEEVGS